MALMASAVQGQGSVPIPELDAAEVVEIAEQYLVSDTHLMDIDEAKPEDYLMMSLEYKSLGMDWGWIVRFMHPEYRTHSVTYMIGNDGLVSTVVGEE